MSARNARSPKAYEAALALCGEVIEKAKVILHYLDVGGGFPAPYLGTVNLPPLEDFMNDDREGRRRNSTCGATAS